MNACLLDRICCPECRNDFSLLTFRGSAESIEEAVLSCAACRAFYPVIRGVPRILSPELCSELVTGYAEFLDKYSGRIPFYAECKTGRGTFLRESIAIGKGFEIEWRAHNRILPEHEYEFTHVLGDLLSKESFRGRTVVDAGCGQGRFAYFSREYGAREVHGFDLSESVLVAQQNLQGIDDIYLIQASFYGLPYRMTFDLAFGIGVIHHLPDPAGGFQILAELVKPGGELFVWVYGHSGIVPVLRFIRRFTLRLPLSVMKHLSAVPASIIFGTNRIHDFLKMVGLESVARRLPFLQYNDRGFNGLQYGVCYDHLTTRIVNYYTEKDLLPWVNEGSFSDARVVARYPGMAGSSWRVWARKKTVHSR